MDFDPVLFIQIFINLMLVLVVGNWANNWGRNKFLWGFFALFGVLPAVIVLSIIGRTKTLKSERLAQRIAAHQQEPKS